MSWVRSALPPAGSRIGARELARVLRERDPAAVLIEGLRSLLGPVEVQLFASGREALRRAFVHFAARTARREVVIPAYTCFSVPSAAVAAGLRVRLVDVDERGALDPKSLERLPLERAAAVVVCNLFGLPEVLGPVRRLAHAAGAAVIDDAAQALGAAGPEGPVGTRGDVGVLSFGRGKPLSALGGGALVWRAAPEGFEVPPVPRAARRRALARALAWDLALSPQVFPRLAAIPALGIGETHFDPSFARGSIDGAALALASAVVPRVREAGQERAARAAEFARRLGAAPLCVPLLAGPPAAGVYPRLALLAPDEATRDAALRALAAIGAGATRMYPADLAGVSALAPQLETGLRCTGARDFAARLLTLPTHGGLQSERLERVIEALSGV